MLKILYGYSKLSQGTTQSFIVHADLPGLPCAMETCCMNILPLIDTHGLLKLGKTGTKYMSLSSLCCGCNIMHSCHQRPKHAAWVFAFEMFLQGRMKERLRGLACKAQQLFWGFCDCAKTVTSTAHSVICGCKPSRALVWRSKHDACLSAFVYQT